MSNRRLDGRDAAAAVALGGGYIAWLLKTASTLGYTRDESFYFQAAGSYGRWFESLLTNRAAAMDRRAVDAAWSANHEHPALIKSLFALSNLFLEQKKHLFAMEGTSYRFPAIVLAGLVIALVYVWGTQARGRVTGFAAAVLLAAMPRFFFHAHLACFDVPIVTMWTFGAYAYWRSSRADEGRGVRRLAWPLVAGLAFGLALDTKHNSWFLPIACGGHAIALQLWILAGRTKLGDRLPTAPAWGPTIRRSVLVLAAMAAIGPAVFFAMWPWIWHDTIPRLREYVLFHLHHEYYNMEFLGRTYWTPPMPRAYAWLMTLATVPVVTLALFAVGVFVRGRAWLAPSVGARRARPMDAAGTDLLWAICVVINYVAWLSTDTPIFGGTKHWMTAYPFLALFAGVGVDAIVRSARRELLRERRRSATITSFVKTRGSAPIAAAIVCAFVLVAPVVETIHSHPWGLASYSPLVGGAPGGAELGLNRSFWGYQSGAVVDFLNREAPPNATVYVHDTTGGAWDMLQRDGRLRRDLRATGSPIGATFGLYEHENHMLGHEYMQWMTFGTVKPVFVAGLDGVPVITVYRSRSGS